MPNQTILFLAANPKGTARLRLDQELRDIGEGLQRAQKRDQFNLEQRWAVRPRDIQRAMLDLGPNILHFSGHGEGEAGLVFEDEIGNTKLVDGAALASLFELFTDQLNCVILNGCYSEVQAQAIAQHIPYVIGMSKAIGDKAAITFAVGFYDALGAGRNVEFAYKLGCAAVQMEGMFEHLTLVLIKKTTESIARNVSNPPASPLTSQQPNPNPNPNIPVEVFISYSYRDQELKETLITHLANLKHQKKITAWQDRAIESGQKWEAQIKQQLESAQIILLLISPDFMASDYYYDIEMQRAIERHNAGMSRVIPIFLRPVDWKGSPFSKLAALPKDAKPITQWSDYDTAFLDVVQGIRRAVEFLAKNTHSQPNLGSPSADNRQSELPEPPFMSPFITGAPIAQPHHFFGRERELKRLFNLLKSHPLQNAAIIGKKRSGKTSLLNYLRVIATTHPAELRPGQKADWLPNPQHYRWAFVDFQDPRRHGREPLLRYLLESMQLPVPDPCDLDRFMDQVSGNTKFPTVILMDEIGVGLQRCPELDDGFWESLRALTTNLTDGNLAFVLATPENPTDLAHHTGHSSPFFNIFGYTTTLGPLTETEAYQLIASSPIPFAEEDRTWILEQSHCYPLLLQILCRERLFGLEEGDSSDAWQAEGLQQLTPFLHLLNLNSP
jgi:hypothetical protein